MPLISGYDFISVTSLGLKCIYDFVQCEMDSRNSESFHDLHEIKNEVSMLISVICLGCLIRA